MHTRFVLFLSSMVLATLMNGARAQSDSVEEVIEAAEVAAAELKSQAAGAGDTAPAEAPEDKEPSLLDVIEWSRSGSGQMGDQAKITIPDGYIFTGADGTIQLMRAMGNLVGGNEVGFFAPELKEGDGNFRWFAVFEYDDSGYVKDDDKDSLDADAMMASMKEGEKHSNKARAEQGYDTLHMVGWELPPYYNTETSNLEWAFKFRSEPGGQLGINHNTRLLGREGVMKVTLVCDPDQFESALEDYQRTLAGFAFEDGRKYTDFKQGDKIAKYGLTGLVLGGGLAVAAKTGLLQKLLKPLLIGLAAAGAFFGRLFGGRSKDKAA